MDPAAMTCPHLFLVILLMLLMRLDGVLGPCPAPCHCTLQILNCSRITNLPGFHQVPFPKPAAPPHPFIYLDFTRNVISSIGKEAWEAYPWAEYLVLKGNSLRRLQNSSLEGLLCLTYLDLSCNKIQIIEKNVFEPVPFLQIINLSGNIIEKITYGTFRAWHGMQFLLKVDLSHNPLAAIQDSYFYSLPSLKLLDLGATKMIPKILEDLLQISVQLRKLILPRKMFCCLCNIKDDIEVLCDTVKLECTESCAINESQCENEESLNKMQEEVMNVLETRKMNGSSLLTIQPERAIPNHDTLALAQRYSSLAAKASLLKSVQRLMQLKPNEPLDVTWVDIHELKKLYLLACLLQAAVKEQILELDKDSLEVAVQNESPAQVSKMSAMESADTYLRKGRHVRKITKENWLGIQRNKAALSRLGRGGQEVSKATASSADRSSDFELYNEAQSQRQLAEGLDPQYPLSFLRFRQAALQSSLKRSVSESPTNTVKLTGSITVDNNDRTIVDNSDRNTMAVLGNRHGAHIMTKEEVLNQLLHGSNPPLGNSKSEVSESSLNELSPHITFSHRGDWEHQTTSVSPPLDLLAHQDDHLLQGELFEAELNKQLTSLVPNAPVRRLISHLIRILKMDCMAPTVQTACAKLISRTGLLMKLFSENLKETSSTWKPYFWPSKNVANTTTGSSRKLEKPLNGIASQGIPEYGYGNKLLLAISVTAIIMIIIAVICLIEICSQSSAARPKTFLGRRKETLPDVEYSRSGSLLMEKPLWLKDMYQTQDETQKNMADKLHDEESVEEEVTRVTWGRSRSFLPESSMKKSSSKTLSVSTSELLPAPAAAPPAPPSPSATPSQKPIMKKSSKATSYKAASTTADEGEDEDEEGTTEQSENLITEATSEAPESGEEEEEEEESE